MFDRFLIQKRLQCAEQTSALLHERPTFLWQKARSVTVGWCVGRNWESNNKWYE